VIHARLVIRRAAWLAPLLILASVLVPALASASIACGLETRVWGFDFENAALVGLEGSQALESRRAYGLGYGGGASDSTVAPSSAAELAAERHAAWSRSIPRINKTVQGLGERALRESGGNWRQSETLFRRYLGGVERRMQGSGPFGLEWQPAAIPGRGRVPAFRTFWNRAQGRYRTFATKGSRRLDAGLTDLNAPGPLRPLVSGYDITLDPSKPSIVRYYQEAFGEIPILDIR
jgi:hypothetical protein